MRASIPCLLVLLALGAATAAAAADETLYIECGLVLPVDGAPIPQGRIVVRGGKIAELGASIERPPFSRLIDARHLTVSPGFIVAQSRIGLPSAASSQRRPGQKPSFGTSAAAKAVDELYALEGDYALLLNEGITTLGLLPVSSVAGILGQVSAISTKAGDEAAMTSSAEAAVLVEVEANGPWREAIGAAFEKAEKEIEKEIEKDKKAKRSGEKDAGKDKAKGGRGEDEKSKDPLVRVLKKQQPLFLGLDGAAAWMAAQDSLELSEAEVTVLEQGLAWELAEDFKKAGVRVITSPLLINRPRTRLPVNRAAEYERLGVPFAFRLPDDNPEGASLLRDQAIEMQRTGCSEEAVLKALTLEGAKALGLGESHGALSKGRRADLLFWTAHPLDPLARLEKILVAGEEVERLRKAAFGDGA